ncbi:hypothetical protein [Microbacterium sp. PMB16]|uniref:hypothetical protein n=1 Tax=Microbacterium sp. PMB16 TaxID=3120157 RepID=UPI003F4B3C4B
MIARRINEREKASDTARWAHVAEQRERTDRCHQLLATRRPTYPTAEHLAGLDQITTLVREDLAYGDHLGYATDADKAASLALPKSLCFSSRASRINVYARAP